MKGYSAMSTQVTVPSDGAGVSHDFILLCTTCQDKDGQAETKDAYIEEVTFLGCPAWFVMCMTGFAIIDMCILFGFIPCVGGAHLYRCYQLSPGTLIQAQNKPLPCKHDSNVCTAAGPSQGHSMPLADYKGALVSKFMHIASSQL